MESKSWRRPTLITPDHVVAGFGCGTPDLDDFLLNRALASSLSGASKTHVVVDKEENRVVGYYSLCSGSVARAAIGPASARKGLPQAVPVVLLARLAVDSKHQGEGLGSALLRSAILTARRAAHTVGVACMFVHAQDETARSFYEHHEFERSPTDPLHLFLLFKDLPPP